MSMQKPFEAAVKKRNYPDMSAAVLPLDWYTSTSKVSSFVAMALAVVASNSNNTLSEASPACLDAQKAAETTGCGST